MRNIIFIFVFIFLLSFIWRFVEMIKEYQKSKLELAENYSSEKEKEKEKEIKFLGFYILFFPVLWLLFSAGVIFFFKPWTLFG